MKPNFYLITGVPGAGKSLIASELQKSLKNALIISTDTLRGEVSELDHLNFVQREDVLVDVAKIVLKNAMCSGSPLIFDDSLYTLNATSREVWYSLAAQGEYDITIVESTHGNALQRSRLDNDAWHQIAAQYEPPTEVEKTLFNLITINGETIEQTLSFEQKNSDRAVA